MPTFKANKAEYDPKLSPEQNVMELFESHNDFIDRVTKVINNLDEENINANLLGGQSNGNN